MEELKCKQDDAEMLTSWMPLPVDTLVSVFHCTKSLDAYRKLIMSTIKKTNVLMSLCWCS
jgi:hypothetical protein